MTDIPFAISAMRAGTVVKVTVAGELDIATAPDLNRQLARHLADVVVVDLSDVTFIDGCGLHALLDARENLDGRLRIIPSEPCMRLFDIAGATDRLPLAPFLTEGTELPRQQECG
jgi:anti-anti-sigma factor